MSARRGYGDEMWRLASEGDAGALHRAADLLLDAGDFTYESHRARAFALAVEGRTDDALAQLNEGWTEEWPFPSAYASDIARVRYLVGDYDKALDALGLGVRGLDRVDGATAELARSCVARDPRLWWRATRVALSGGTVKQRLGHAAGIVRARLAPC